MQGTTLNDIVLFALSFLSSVYPLCERQNGEDVDEDDIELHEIGGIDIEESHAERECNEENEVEVNILHYTNTNSSESHIPFH